jgi:hypothetical protein
LDSSLRTSQPEERQSVNCSYPSTKQIIKNEYTLTTKAQKDTVLPQCLNKEIKMEMKIIASGIGASIPKIDVGFSLFSGAYILLRATPKAKPHVFGIATTPEGSNKNGTFIASHIVTSWIKIDQNKHNWLCNRSSLVGKTCELKIEGTIIYKSHVGISLKIIDAFNEIEFSLEKVAVESHGGQLSDTKVLGIIKDMMGKTQSGGSLCVHP